MSDAIRDKNNIPTLIALSYVDGVTPVAVKINSTSRGILTDRLHTVSSLIMNAVRDSNYITTLMAKNSVTGETIPVFADPVTGGILV